MTYTVDPKLVPWFIVGIVVWMAFVVCVGYFGSRGRHDGEKFVTGGRDMNAFLIFCTLGATIIGTGSTIGAISDGFSHAWGGALFCTASATPGAGRSSARDRPSDSFCSRPSRACARRGSSR